MMVSGLAFDGSTILARICASDKRAPTPLRSGARLPWKRSSGMGAAGTTPPAGWRRSAAPARDPRPRKRAPGRAPGGPPPASHQLDAVVLERHRADALAGRLGVGVQHRRRRDADRRLADSAPDRATRRHDDALHLRHLRDAHRVVVVEVRLLDASVLHRALLEEQRGEAVYERAGDLALDLRRVHRV